MFAGSAVCSRAALHGVDEEQFQDKKGFRGHSTDLSVGCTMQCLVEACFLVLISSVAQGITFNILATRMNTEALIFARL